MKRNAFVLVLLILIIAPTGCRRRMRLFGKQGAPCTGARAPYPMAAPTPAPAPAYQVVCPTPVCATQACPPPMCETCPPGTTTTYGGTIEGGGYPGQMIETVPIEGSAQGGVISGDYFGSSTVGSPSTVPADLVPTLSGAGVDSGLYGHPMFQVIADRKLAPGESLPAQAGVSATPQSDKTAQAPKKK